MTTPAAAAAVGSDSDRTDSQSLSNSRSAVGMFDSTNIQYIYCLDLIISNESNIQEVLPTEQMDESMTESSANTQREDSIIVENIKNDDQVDSNIRGDSMTILEIESDAIPPHNERLLQDEGHVYC